jgi:AcrR family transcriptional regulator
LEGGFTLTRITKSVPERRQEIIDTARALFIEQGFDKTQVSDIPKKMNVAQGLVYHYFKSKTEILYAVIDELADEHLKAIETLLSGTQGTALDRLSIFLSSQPDFDQFGKLIPSIAGESAIAEYCSNKMTTSTGPLLLSLIEQGNADGSWNCEYPKETVVFILRGIGGFFTDLPLPGVDTKMKQVFTSIFARLLGFSQE